MIGKSTLGLPFTTPLGKEEQKKLLLVVNGLLDDPEAIHFSTPVDWQTLGLLDYPTIVTSPMDLGTVKKGLQASKYKTVEECLDDIQLVWDCCRLYNGSGSWIMNIALRLEKQFKRLVRNYLAAFKIGFKKGSTTPPKSKPEPPPTPQVAQSLPKKKKVEPPPPQLPVAVTPQQKLHERRLKFIEALNLLTKDQLGVITTLLIKNGVEPEWRQNRLSFQLGSISQELLDKVLEVFELWGIIKPVKGVSSTKK